LNQPSFRLALLAAALACAATAHAQLKPVSRGEGVRPAPVPTPAQQTAQAAPASNPEAENAGKMAAHAWLSLLDRRDWGTAWDASSAVFRQSVPLGNWMDAIPKVRQPYGALVEREAVEAVYRTTLPGRPDGQYVSVMFATKFEKQQIQEVVTTVRESDGRWRVTGYSPTPAK
jgi:hypothetical protein